MLSPLASAQKKKDQGETTRKTEEKVREKEEKKETWEPQRQTHLCPPADKQSERQADTQGQVAAVKIKAM